MSNLSAIVLAAGASRRMGTVNKLLLPVKGRPMIVRVIENVLDSGIAEVIVVLGHEADRVITTLADYTVRLVHNPQYREGMGTSIRTGIEAASPGASGYMICLSDLPFIESKTYKALIELFDELHQQDDMVITVPVCEGHRGHPVIFSRAYRSQMLACSGDEGARKIVQAHSEQVRLCEVYTRSILLDLDTPEAYREAMSSDEELKGKQE